MVPVCSDRIVRRTVFRSKRARWLFFLQRVTVLSAQALVGNPYRGVAPRESLLTFRPARYLNGSRCRLFYFSMERPSMTGFPCTVLPISRPGWWLGAGVALESVGRRDGRGFSLTGKAGPSLQCVGESRSDLGKLHGFKAQNLTPPRWFP